VLAVYTGGSALHAGTWEGLWGGTYLTVLCRDKVGVIQKAIVLLHFTKGNVVYCSNNPSKAPPLCHAKRHFETRAVRPELSFRTYFQKASKPFQSNPQKEVLPNPQQRMKRH
jgi:hypothetical protein